jgi:hypothetical protein
VHTSISRCMKCYFHIITSCSYKTYPIFGRNTREDYKIDMGKTGASGDNLEIIAIIEIFKFCQFLFCV